MAVLQHVLRQLLLPCQPSGQHEAVRTLRKELGKLGIPRADWVTWLSAEEEAWRKNGAPRRPFKALVRSVIGVMAPEHGSLLADNYFTLHANLVESHSHSHDSAKALLSYAPLICSLAKNEKMSAAQISLVISARHPAADASRQSVGQILTKLQLKAKISPRQIMKMFKREKHVEGDLFADADLGTAASTVAATATRLGVYKIDAALHELMPSLEQEDIHSPYLQILHYQCCVADRFDHVVTDLYEFEPRGEAARALFELYPDDLVGAGNPFLNNAKAVERLNEGWVRSRSSKERPAAAALLKILSDMDGMSFPARRELARYLRLWLHRVIRLMSQTTVPLPDVLSAAQINRLFAAVSQGNTNTYGILEQRIVDALTSIDHRNDDGWRSRGLGDSVNATNLSKRKLGDCDYQSTATQSIRAYEAHGGELSEIYLEDHIRTLEGIIAARADELAGTDAIINWNISVTFIAQSISARPRNIRVGDASIEISVLTFEQYLIQPRDITERHHAIEAHVLRPLKERRTPYEARVAFLRLIGSP